MKQKSGVKKVIRRVTHYSRTQKGVWDTPKSNKIRVLFDNYAHLHLLAMSSDAPGRAQPERALDLEFILGVDTRPAHYCADGNLFYVSGAYGCLLDPATGAQFHLRGHSSTIAASALSENSSTIVTLSQDSIIAWDALAKAPIAVLESPHMGDSVVDLTMLCSSGGACSSGSCGNVSSSGALFATLGGSDERGQDVAIWQLEARSPSSSAASEQSDSAAPAVIRCLTRCKVPSSEVQFHLTARTVTSNETTGGQQSVTQQQQQLVFELATTGTRSVCFFTCEIEPEVVQVDDRNARRYGLQTCLETSSDDGGSTDAALEASAAPPLIAQLYGHCVRPSTPHSVLHSVSSFLPRGVLSGDQAFSFVTGTTDGRLLVWTDCDAVPAADATPVAAGKRSSSAASSVSSGGGDRRNTALPATRTVAKVLRLNQRDWTAAGQPVQASAAASSSASAGRDERANGISAMLLSKCGRWLFCGFDDGTVRVYFTGATGPGEAQLSRTLSSTASSNSSTSTYGSGSAALQLAAWWDAGAIASAGSQRPRDRSSSVTASSTSTGTSAIVAGSSSGRREGSGIVAICYGPPTTLGARAGSRNSSEGSSTLGGSPADMCSVTADVMASISGLPDIIVVTRNAVALHLPGHNARASAGTVGGGNGGKRRNRSPGSGVVASTATIGTTGAAASSGCNEAGNTAIGGTEPHGPRSSRVRRGSIGDSSAMPLHATSSTAAKAVSCSSRGPSPTQQANLLMTSPQQTMAAPGPLGCGGGIRILVEGPGSRVVSLAAFPTRRRVAVILANGGVQVWETDPPRLLRSRVLTSSTSSSSSNGGGSSNSNSAAAGRDSTDGAGSVTGGGGGGSPGTASIGGGGGGGGSVGGAGGKSGADVSGGSGVLAVTPTCIAVDPNSRWCAVGTTRGNVFLLDLHSPSLADAQPPLLGCSRPEDASGVCRIAFCADGLHMGTSDQSGHVSLFRLTRTREQRLVTMPPPSVTSTPGRDGSTSSPRSQSQSQQQVTLSGLAGSLSASITARLQGLLISREVVGGGGGGTQSVTTTPSGRLSGTATSANSVRRRGSSSGGGANPGTTTSSGGGGGSSGNGSTGSHGQVHRWEYLPQDNGATSGLRDIISDSWAYVARAKVHSAATAIAGATGAADFAPNSGGMGQQRRFSSIGYPSSHNAKAPQSASDIRVSSCAGLSFSPVDRLLIERCRAMVTATRTAGKKGAAAQEGGQLTSDALSSQQPHGLEGTECHQLRSLLSSAASNSAKEPWQSRGLPMLCSYGADGSIAAFDVYASSPASGLCLIDRVPGACGYPTGGSPLTHLAGTWVDHSITALSPTECADPGLAAKLQQPGIGSVDVSRLITATSDSKLHGWALEPPIIDAAALAAGDTNDGADHYSAASSGTPPDGGGLLTNLINATAASSSHPNLRLQHVKCVLAPRFGGSLTALTSVPVPAYSEEESCVGFSGGSSASRRKQQPGATVRHSAESALSSCAVAFGTSTGVIGLVGLPLDGRPSAYVGAVAHSGPVASVAATFDGAQLLSCGGSTAAGDNSASVCVWRMAPHRLAIQNNNTISGNYSAAANTNANAEAAAGGPSTLGSTTSSSRRGLDASAWAKLLCPSDPAGAGEEVYRRAADVFQFLASEAAGSLGGRETLLPLSRIGQFLNTLGYHPTDRALQAIKTEVIVDRRCAGQLQPESEGEGGGSNTPSHASSAVSTAAAASTGSERSDTGRSTTTATLSGVRNSNSNLRPSFTASAAAAAHTRQPQPQQQVPVSAEEEEIDVSLDEALRLFLCYQ